jgi:hypothetical protein
MKRFSVNKVGVTHDIFDEEVVALNLIDGKYYSMEGTASFIWQAILQHATTTAIISKLKLLPDNGHHAVETEVEQFLLQLQNEGLIIELERNEPTEPYAELSLPAKYSAPQLLVFTDMQEVIALDPVHDVSEKGWPQKLDGPEK